MGEENVVFVPLTKVDLEKREVWGIAAEEAPDKSGEVMDYAASKPHFLTWSEQIRKASGGKSLGNVRAMHAPVAAGKVIHLEPRDAEKVIAIGTKIVDDQEWQKVLEGVYTGFSVGGHYGKRWADEEDPNLVRYEAIPSEISLADNPAMYGATFEVIKANGPSEMRKFVGAEALEKVDLEEWVRTVRRAWYEQFGSEDPEDEGYNSHVKTVLHDATIVYTDGNLAAYPYEMTEEGVAFGEPFAVRQEYVPVDQAEPDEPESEPEPESDEGEDEDMAQTVEIDLQKTVSEAVDPLTERLSEAEALLKALPDDLQHRLDEQGAQVADLVKRLEALEAQPASEPPVIREVPGSEHLDAEETPTEKTLNLEELRRLAANEPNPVLKAEYNRQIILAEMALRQR
jgi:hypothetical protein